MFPAFGLEIQKSGPFKMIIKGSWGLSSSIAKIDILKFVSPNSNTFITASFYLTLRSETIFGNWKPFKNDERYFLFNFISSFCSQDIQAFVLAFWLCIETAWLKRSG